MPSRLVNGQKCCTGCKEWKLPDGFRLRTGSHLKGRGYLRSRCRVCEQAHKVANRPTYRAYGKKGRTVIGLKNKTFIFDYLDTHPCVDCGEDDPVVLEFDHVDPKQKLYNVVSMAHNCYSLERIKAEVAKCVIRCANCHRRKSAAWWDSYRHRRMALRKAS